MRGWVVGGGLGVALVVAAWVFVRPPADPSVDPVSTPVATPVHSPPPRTASAAPASDASLQEAAADAEGGALSAPPEPPVDLTEAEQVALAQGLAREADDRRDALREEMSTLLDAADDCAFDGLAGQIDLEVFDPAMPVRSMLDHLDMDVERATEDAARSAARVLRGQLEDEGCLVTE